MQPTFTGVNFMQRNAGFCKWFVVACLFMAAASPSVCLAQKSDDTTKPPANNSTTSTTGSTATKPASSEEIPPAVARELDDLKARISELEALLKAKIAQDNAAAAAAATSSSAAAPSVNSTAAAPATTTTPPAAPAASPSASSLAASAAPLPAAPQPANLYAGPAAPGAPAGSVAAASTPTVASAPSQPGGPATDAVSISAVVSSQDASAQKAAPSEPFAFADWTWLNGNARTKDEPLDTKFFTPEIRADIDYVYDFNHPEDHSIGGSSEIFRSGEVQVTQLGVGGDFHFDNVRARLMTQFGMYSATTPRNDASPGLGQWDLDTAYRYVSEAYGGYHFNVLHGINVDAGIFMSYIGLFSYYNFDNWAYQPSYVSSNTPWFFNGLRVQVFPTDKLKIEYWYINGWQSYGRFNKWPGMGGQIIYRPNSRLAFVFNNYGMGTDTLGVPDRSRIHTDDSVEVKYYDNPEKGLDKMAFSLTGDAGCEYGGGVSCYHNSAGGPKQSFLGFMAYDRMWFHNDKFGLTLGGGRMNNPGRYLVLLPPINGANAISGTNYFPEAPGLPFKAWDASTTFDWMPSQYITFRWEYDHRNANVPYFTGPGGITPAGGNQGAPGSTVPGFTPDLQKVQSTIEMAILVKF
jgi:hypothetical protein